MRDYRAYILGIEGHRFIKAKDFLNNHPDDAAALNAAKQLLDGHEVEVWDCGRLVARFSANGEIASPELAPVLVPATPADEASAVPSGGAGQAGPSVSLGRVSEMAGAASKENHLLLGW
jgi:hypothetical protein